MDGDKCYSVMLKDMTALEQMAFAHTLNEADALYVAKNFKWVAVTGGRLDRFLTDLTHYLELLDEGRYGEAYTLYKWSAALTGHEEE